MRAWFYRACLVALLLLSGCGGSKVGSGGPSAAHVSPELASELTTMDGHVTCVDHTPVAGVWIALTTHVAQSGFASWNVPDPRAPWTAQYQFSLPKDDTFVVHVGCGLKQGDPTHKAWLHEDWSRDPLRPSTRNFSCGPPLEGQFYGTCREGV